MGDAPCQPLLVLLLLLCDVLVPLLHSAEIAGKPPVSWSAVKNVTQPPSVAQLQLQFSADRWHVYWLPLESGARCLDGPPYGFVPLLQPDFRVRGWVIVFGGGGWCLTQHSCHRRHPAKNSKSALGTSKLLALRQSRPKFDGILNKKHSPFRHHNIAYFHYCDGSSFLGDVAHPVPMGKLQFYFRGAANLRVGIDHLKRVFHLDDAPDVVLLGHSAGGLSVLANLQRWRREVATRVALYAIVDGAMFHRRCSFDTALDLWNATAALNPDCLARPPNNTQWQCLLPRYLRPVQQVPVFVSQSRFDIVPQVFLWGNDMHITPANIERLLHFGDEAAEAISAVNYSGVWFVACRDAFSIHSMMLARVCLQHKVAGMTLCQAIARWYADRGRTPLKVVEGCRPSCPIPLRLAPVSGNGTIPVPAGCTTTTGVTADGSKLCGGAVPGAPVDLCQHGTF